MSGQDCVMGDVTLYIPSTFSNWSSFMMLGFTSLVVEFFSPDHPICKSGGFERPEQWPPFS